MFELLGPLTTSTCDATTATHHMDEPPRASPSSLEEYSFLFTSMFSSSALFLGLLAIPASLLLWDMGHETPRVTYGIPRGTRRCGVVVARLLACCRRSKIFLEHISHFPSHTLNTTTACIYSPARPHTVPTSHVCPSRGAQTRQRRRGRVPARLQLHHSNDTRPSHGLSTCPAGCALPLPLHSLPEHDHEAGRGRG